DPGDDPAYALAVASAALDARALAVARESLARVDADRSRDLAPERARVAARLEALDGHPERVAGDAAATDPAVAHDLAVAWTARGDAASAREAGDAARDASARAAALAGDSPVGLAASAGLVATAGPSEATRLAAVDDPVLRRAVDLLGATRAVGA